MHQIKEVDVHTAKNWLDAGEAMMIDVREKNEHEMLHVPGVDLLPATYFEPGQIPPHEGKKLIVMCHSGRRSSMVCNMLMDNNIDCYNLAGGIMCWHNNELPVVEED